MIPPDVQAVVSKTDEALARETWENYQGRKYLRKPTSVIGTLWYDSEAEKPGTPSWTGNKGKWVRFGTWPKVIENAIAIAKALSRNTARLEAYQNRKLKKAKPES